MARASKPVQNLTDSFLTDLQSRVSHLETQLGGVVSDVTSVGRDLKGIRAAQDNLATKVDALIVAVTTLQATKPSPPLESIKTLLGITVSMATIFAIVVGGILWLAKAQPPEKEASLTARELSDILQQRSELPQVKRQRPN